MGKHPQLGADSTVPAVKGQDEPLANDLAIQRFFQLVLEHVRYQEFIDLKPPLSVDRFLQLRTLTILDRYYEVADEKIETRMGVSADHLATLRAHPHYGAVLASIEAHVEKLAKPRTMDEWAEEVEDRMAGEMFLAGTSKAALRDRVPAIEAFLDRTSAKKGREAELPRTPMFPDDVQRIMEWSLKMGAMAATHGMQAGGGEDVDAGVLNVPRPPAKRIAGPPELPSEAPPE